MGNKNKAPSAHRMATSPVTALAQLRRERIRAERQTRTDKYGNKLHPAYNREGELIHVTIPE